MVAQAAAGARARGGRGRAAGWRRPVRGGRELGSWAVSWVVVRAVRACAPPRISVPIC